MSAQKRKVLYQESWTSQTGKPPDVMTVSGKPPDVMDPKYFAAGRLGVIFFLLLL